LQGLLAKSIMKKISFILLALCFGFIGFAQRATFGLKGGVNLATFGGTNNDAYSNKVGYNVGFQLHLHMAPSIAVQPELVYSNQGAKYTVTGTEHSLHLNYLNVPVLLQYMAGGGFRLQTGPQVGFLTSVNDAVDGNSTNIFDKNDFKKTDFAWSFGLGYATAGGIGIDARYNLGLSNINNTGLSNNLKNNVAQVGIFVELR
jgi:hypothetical protein